METRFPHDYIPPRKDDAPLMTLSKNDNHTLVMPGIPEGVIIDEDMLGKVPQIRYEDHEMTETKKFPKLAPHHYLEMKVDPSTKQIIHVPWVWARELE